MKYPVLLESTATPFDWFARRVAGDEPARTWLFLLLESLQDGLWPALSSDAQAALITFVYEPRSELGGCNELILIVSTSTQPPNGFHLSGITAYASVLPGENYNMLKPMSLSGYLVPFMVEHVAMCLFEDS